MQGLDALFEMMVPMRMGGGTLRHGVLRQRRSGRRLGMFAFMFRALMHSSSTKRVPLNKASQFGLIQVVAARVSVWGEHKHCKLHFVLIAVRSEENGPIQAIRTF